MAQPEVAAFVPVDAVFERTDGPGLHADKAVAWIDGSVRIDGARPVAGSASEGAGAVAMGAFALEGVYFVERVECRFAAGLAFFEHPGYQFVLDRKLEDAMVVLGKIDSAREGGVADCSQDDAREAEILEKAHEFGTLERTIAGTVRALAVVQFLGSVQACQKTEIVVGD